MCKELKDTVEMMQSEDFEERFKAEYEQLRIRIEKLEKMCEKWDRNELIFEPTCPRSIYDMQLRAMKDYLTILEARAVMEKIEL